MLYSVSGVVRYTKSKDTQYVQPDSVVITACNTPLTFTKVTKNWIFYYFVIGGSHAKLFYNLIRTQSTVTLSNPFSNLLELFMELYTTCSMINQAPDTWHYMKSSLLIHNIFNTIYEQNYNINTIKDITPVQQSIVHTALKFIQENYQQDLTIDTICNEISFSKCYFCKIFKKQIGVTVHQYVNEYRVNKAKELLAYSKLSVNSIATQVGFKNSITFLRAFKKSVHMTPSEYRNYY